MSEEPIHPTLDQLTEATAEAIIFTLQPGAIPDDPKPKLIELLRRYLAAVREQEFEAALREQQLAERDELC